MTVLTVLVIGILGAGVLYRQFIVNSNQKIFQPTPSTIPSITSGTNITVTGNVDCLPFKNTGGIQPMSCAMGLKGNDGTYWALNNIQSALVEGKVASGDIIKVSGTSVSYEGPLNIAGTINVTSVEVVRTYAPNISE